LQDIQPDRPDADDADLIAGFKAPAFNRVQRVGQRVGRRSRFVRHIVRNLEQIDFGHRKVLRESAVVARTEIFIIPAKRIVSLAAVFALETGHNRRNRNPVPNLKILYFFTRFHDLTRKFVARYDRRYVRAVLVDPGNIRTAHADRHHLYQYFVIFDLRNRYLLQP
jgi:hypothetical protein